jgi:Cu/Ag efflux pump CusA
VLRAKADEVKHAMEGIDGTVDVKAERLLDIPQIQVTVDLAAAQRHGLKPGDVRRATSTVISGE